MTTQREPVSDQTLAIGDSCLCLELQRASRAIARCYDEALRPVGLNNGQFSLLSSVNRPTAPTMGGLAERLAMDRTTVTANLRPLVRRGLVEIGPDEQDARVRRVWLTEAGLALLAEALDRWCAVNDAVTAQLQGSDLAAFRGRLRKIAAGLSDTPSRAGIAALDRSGAAT